MKKYILFFFLPVLLIGLHACDEGRIYENAVVATGEGRTVKMTGRISGVDKWSGDIQQKIFNATCTACHGLSTTPGGGLNLLEGHSHADLVNRASTTVDGKMRVMPGNASESVLHLILGTDISSDWRIDHSQMITSSDMQSLIGNWIDDGAQQ